MKILAVITAAETAHACLDAALVAASVDPMASIEALHVVVDPEQLVTSTEEIQIQRLREVREGSARERERACQAAFITWNAGLDPKAPRVNWKSVAGAEEEMVEQEAHDADLIVLARGHDMDSNDAQHAALVRRGRAVLIVPGAWRARTKRFDHIVIALSDTPSAEDAIREALPWLKPAQQVIAIRIGEERDLAAKFVDQLRDVGVKAELRMVAADSENLGTQIVHEANSLGAQLLVAGAYRHSPLLEWLLGGTTRHMLSAADLPLLLAHRAHG